MTICHERCLTLVRASGGQPQGFLTSVVTAAWGWSPPRHSGRRRKLPGSCGRSWFVANAIDSSKRITYVGSGIGSGSFEHPPSRPPRMYRARVLAGLRPKTPNTTRLRRLTAIATGTQKTPSRSARYAFRDRPRQAALPPSRSAGQRAVIQRLRAGPPGLQPGPLGPTLYFYAALSRGECPQLPGRAQRPGGASRTGT
jgi:hypothetical protein